MTAHDTDAPKRIMRFEELDERCVNAMVVHGASHRLIDVPGYLALLDEMLIDPAVVAVSKRHPVLHDIYRWFVALIELFGIVEPPVPEHFVWHFSQPLDQSVYFLKVWVGNHSSTFKLVLH